VRSAVRRRQRRPPGRRALGAPVSRQQPNGRVAGAVAGKRPGSSPEERLAELYKNMPADQLVKQGRQHLENRADAALRRHGRLGMLVVWTLIIGALVVIGAFSLWLLFMARSSGASFAQVRQQALSAYGANDE
jgi:hypothetical protein